MRADLLNPSVGTLSEQISELIDIFPGMMYRCNNNASSTWQYVSPGCLNLTGYQVNDFIKGQIVALNELAHPDDSLYVQDAINNIIRKQSEFDIEFRILTLDDQIKWVRNQGRVVMDAMGNVCGIHGYMTDITAKKEIEQGLIESIKHKDAQLMDIHHRVNNNLQVIISLMNLQCQQEKNEKVQDKLTALKHRVQSIALAHERMYESGFSFINLNNYLESLGHTLCRIYDKSGLIELQIAVNDIYLNMNTAIPCGLILNELITNSLKYAFSNQRKGRIHIEFNHKSTDYILIIYRDDGTGLPENINLETAETIGLSLIRILARQLNGNVRFMNDRGLICIISFPVS